jgi:hypothetical protein
MNRREMRSASCMAGPCEPTKKEAQARWPGQPLVACDRCRGYHPKKKGRRR